MADLDVTDILDDPDFFSKLQYIRNAQTIGADGVAFIAPPLPVTLYGVVTSKDGDILVRGADGEYNEDNFTLHTRTRLISGEDNNTADIVLWKGKQYTVAHVNDYSHFGPGFVAASCEKKPLKG